MKLLVSLLCAAWILTQASVAAAQGVTVTPRRPGATPIPQTTLAQLLSGGAASYGAFTKDAVKQEGLFTLWRKDGRVFLELREDQFDKDYLLHIGYANGIGAFGVSPGDLFAQDARIVRFERDQRRVVLLWKQTRFVAEPGTPLENAVRESQTDSPIGLLSPAAEDKEHKLVILDLGVLLTDVLDLSASLSDPSPLGISYRSDPSRSYFGPSKAFPKNVIIETDQTFASGRTTPLDTVPDSRSLLMKVKYQFMELPAAQDYMPRLGDERVGFFEDPHMQFDHPTERDNLLHYILRWDIKPSDPTKPRSPAKNPIVYTISNTIPYEYRAAVKAGVLEWNKAFERFGITGAIQVQDQPDDPNFDPDDVRYNVIRWLTDADPGGLLAETTFAWDPRDGRIFQSSVLVDAQTPRLLNMESANLGLDLRSIASAPLKVDIDTNPSPGFDPRASDSTFATGLRAQASFGALALGYGTSVPPAFMNAYIKDTVMHEVGHTLGLSHNFIGHEAYSEKQIEDRAFTQRNGISSSVMDYVPFNVSPPGRPQGSYFMPTIGPYDYHAIAFGYAPILNARTPRDERSTLNSWASVSNNPLYRYRGDEDAFWNGHAVDPRVEPFMLTNDPIHWCGEQLAMTQSLFKTLDSRFPAREHPWEDQRDAFLALVVRYYTCTAPMAHYIAGEYLSRARPGDPNAGIPLTPVPRALSKRAFDALDRYLFSASALRFSPETLRRTVYTERLPLDGFGYDVPMRHDVPVVAVAAALQNAALRYMFNPVVLQRLADMPTKARPGQAMSLTDLFEWMQTAVYRDLASGTPATSQVHRNLQRRYVKLLSFMTNQPIAVYPYDAQALARYELGELQSTLRRGLANRNLDVLTRAHLEAMQTDVTRALEAKLVL